MKVFDYYCERCDKTVEKWVKRDTIQYCDCGYQMNKKLSAPTPILDTSFPGRALKGK